MRAVLGTCNLFRRNLVCKPSHSVCGLNVSQKLQLQHKRAHSRHNPKQIFLGCKIPYFLLRTLMYLHMLFTRLIPEWVNCRSNNIPTLTMLWWAVLITTTEGSTFLPLDASAALPLAHHSKGYLSACLLARDALLDIRDWVEWHHSLGVEKVFLYDHNSNPPMHTEIDDFIADGIMSQAGSSHE